jgi:hypothetical protein
VLLPSIGVALGVALGVATGVAIGVAAGVAIGHLAATGRRPASPRSPSKDGTSRTPCAGNASRSPPTSPPLLKKKRP